MAELVAEAQRAGEIGGDVDAGLFVRLALGMSNSLVDWYRPDGTWSTRQIADALIGLVMKPTKASITANGRRSG
ncbi:hypothetical protein D3C83_101610 [compost metagenome]